MVTTVPIRTLAPGQSFRDGLGRDGRVMDVGPTGARVVYRLPTVRTAFRTRWGDEVAFQAARERELTISLETPVTPLAQRTDVEADIAQVRQTMRELGYPQADIDEEVHRMERARG